MTLTKEVVEEFQALHIAKFGKPISYSDAEQELKDIAELVRIASTKENNNDRTV